MSAKPSLNTPLKRAKGLGSAHSGLHHWVVQRITAIALIPLTVWFVASLVCLAGSNYDAATAFFREPLTAVFMASIIIAAFWHAALGLQVVIEDYVHKNAAKIIALLVVKLGCFALGAISLLAIIKLAIA